VAIHRAVFLAGGKPDLDVAELRPRAPGCDRQRNIQRGADVGTVGAIPVVADDFDGIFRLVAGLDGRAGRAAPVGQDGAALWNQDFAGVGGVERCGWEGIWGRKSSAVGADLVVRPLLMVSQLQRDDR
jgi:hypothetical protein